MPEHERIFEQRNGLFYGMQMVLQAVKTVVERNGSEDNYELAKSIAAYEVLQEFYKLYDKKYKELGG